MCGDQWELLGKETGLAAEGPGGGSGETVPSPCESPLFPQHSEACRPGRPPTVPWWLLSNLVHPGVPWGLAQPSSCPGPEALEAVAGLLCSPPQGNADGPCLRP